MWNSGGKNVLSQIGRGFKSAAGGLFGPQEGSVSYPSPELIQFGASQAPGVFQSIKPLGEELAGIGSDLYQRALNLDLGEAGEEALFGQASRRFREQILPGLAARGVATSGRGMKAEQEGVEQLATTFGERAFGRQVQREQMVQEAARGLAFLKTLPVELQTRILDIMIRQGGTAVPTGPSIFSQLTGFFSGGGGSAAAGLGMGGGAVPPIPI